MQDSIYLSIDDLIIRNFENEDSFLNLRNFSLKDEHCKYLCNILNQNRNRFITSIGLSDNHNITTEGYKYLGEMLQNNSNITELDFKPNQIYPNRCQQLSKGLNRNRYLKKLKFAFSEMGNEGCRYLSEALCNNPQNALTHLDLAASEITEEGIQYLSDVICSRNRSLVTLKLVDNKIGVKGCEILKEVLNDNCSLQKLSIFNNDIPDQGTRQIIQSLENNDTLTTLDIGANYIYPETIRYLGDVLKKNTSLTLLDISATTSFDMDDDAIDDAYVYLSNCLQENNTLINIEESGLLTKIGRQQIDINQQQHENAFFRNDLKFMWNNCC